MDAYTGLTPQQRLSDHLLVQEVCSAPDALQAHNRFKAHAARLKDWWILFAEKSEAGAIKVQRQCLGASGILSSIFRGKSLWRLDQPFVTQSGTMQFHGGSATYVDANAASCIRRIAYAPTLQPAVLERAGLINQIGPKLQQLNPYFYLWETLRSWDEKTVVGCRESLAAIHALRHSGSKLSAEWGRRYRAEFREHSELVAKGQMAEFKRDFEAGIYAALEEQLDLMEAVLVRTQIIELSPGIDRERKLTQLITYMHEELSTIMLRELIVCADFLLRRNQCRLSAKLNALQDRREPLAHIRNCAWDLHIPRAMDALTATRPDQAPHLDHYVAEVISFDGDVVDILEATKLRAVAVHRPSQKTFPFLDQDLDTWLAQSIGSKRLGALAHCFEEEAFLDRARRRESVSVRSVLAADRERLLHLIRRRRG